MKTPLKGLKDKKGLSGSTVNDGGPNAQVSGLKRDSILSRRDLTNSRVNQDPTLSNWTRSFTVSFVQVAQLQQFVFFSCPNVHENHGTVNLSSGTTQQ